jgi:N-acetylmuramoyl-L-alanine amidase
MEKKKIAFVIGHSTVEKGAFSQALQMSEFEFWSNLSKKMWHLGDVFEHGTSKSYTTRQKLTSEKTAQYDIVFELHFNGSDNLKSNGCEALYWNKNEQGKAIAEKFCQLVHKKMEIKNRGAKPISDKMDRGYGFLYQTRGTAILLEPFFGSNELDCMNFDECLFIEVIQEIIEDINV